MSSSENSQSRDFRIDGMASNDLRDLPTASRAPEPSSPDLTKIGVVQTDTGIASPPETIGRYRVRRVLGDGGFGRVYLCIDEVLNRQVAVKIPHASRITRPEDIDAYLAEARILASFDHPYIVPVYDCGRTDDGLCYSVSKYIDGSDLAARLKHTPPSFAATAELITRICDALHYAHLRRVIHRDVKPANIMIDQEDHPWLVDFGIALKEEDYGRIQPTMGTLPYMSPEQLRGEGHLVDGRTDVFSTGVMLYQMLTGRRPFPSKRLIQDLSIEPRPPRQLDDTIPKELERICLKALAPRVVDRYNTALDMATDLREFLHSGDPELSRSAAAPGLSGVPVRATSDIQAASSKLAIVPKGLRSFDSDDAGFFLELLPGARNQNGMPESVQFWINRLSDFDPDRAFRIGLIYGPSGCGKSSFMKAAVIPRLPPSVTALYMECSGADTEFRLLRLLRRQFPALSHELNLIESLAAFRRGKVLAGGRKLVLVLDQFEQWLHAHSTYAGEEMVLALRQCDGEHLQCVIGVRDDFWMAVTHFTNELEVSIVPSENLAAIDLFSLRHARKVLTAIGQAYQVLPAEFNEFQSEQKEFIAAAIKDLAQNDRIVPVHLALFAEMFKDQPWEIGTLKRFGGIAGVGARFLEETFNGRAASPGHRLHQRAARRVLRALLPDSSTEIKGNMRSHDELMVSSGYQNSPKDFDALIQMLDSELRIITPADPEGMEASGIVSGSESGECERYYHLAHDYLVPSLRDWLTRKQKETRRGRAELALADHTSNWLARPTARSLPSLLEWFNIRLFVPRRILRENSDQRALMNAATRHYAGRLLIVILVSCLTFWAIRYQGQKSSATSLVNSLKTSATAEVPGILAQISDYRSLVNPMLLELGRADDPKHALHANMALPPELADPQNLLNGLWTAPPGDFATVRNAWQTAAGKAGAISTLWLLLNDSATPASKRFRAGLALGDLDPPSEALPEQKWQDVATFMSHQLLEEIASDPRAFAPWMLECHPLRNLLHAPLKTAFLDKARGTGDRAVTASILAELLNDQAQPLAELLLDADSSQYHRLIPALTELGVSAQSALETAYSRPLPAQSKSEIDPVERHRQIEAAVESRRRKGAAAIALLEFGQTGPLISVLTAVEDPDLTHQTEYRLSQLSVHPEMLFELMNSADTTLKAALLRSLGGMVHDNVPTPLRAPVVDYAKKLFVQEKETDVHSAAEWLLRSWGHQQELTELLNQPSVPHAYTPDKDWYVNSGGQTMAVFHGPIRIQTGAPEGEEDRDSDEVQAVRTINRDFAMGTTEVPMIEFLRLFKNYRHKATLVNPTLDCPAVMMTWNMAAEYCYWLSLEEGLPDDQICYILNDGVVVPEENYLHRTGYRLPTEAEWEYACRAQSTSPYFWGNNLEIAPRYSWTAENSDGRNHPVATKCPNRFGLYDMHGSASEWILEPYVEKLLDSEDVEIRAALPDDDPFKFDFRGVTRGGNVFAIVQKARSAARSEGNTYGAGLSLGFRVVRTIEQDNK
ncbi:MAG: SUMF1/EgtB/PvdO family nonheme iron enzyme [Planctomycetaceae bacterium]|nr:SUMF1/EgtB/PvdO family nonheme iron enzyme [Planctomycetaceae bacterium]